MKENDCFCFTETFWNMSSKRRSASERWVRSNNILVAWKTCFVRCSQRAPFPTVKNRETITALLGVGGNVCSALKKTFDSSGFQFIRRQSWKSAKFGLVEENAHINSLNLKTSMKEKYKRGLKSTLLVAFHDNEFYELEAIVWKKMRNEKGIDSGKFWKGFQERGQIFSDL